MEQITLEMSDEFACKLNNIAKRNGLSRALTIGRALALLAVADEAQTEGNAIAIVDAELNPIHRLVGIF
jgi:predicted transcriptional regulator